MRSPHLWQTTPVNQRMKLFILTGRQKSSARRIPQAVGPNGELANAWQNSAFCDSSVGNQFPCLRALLCSLLCDLETLEQGDLSKVHDECEDGRRHKGSSHNEYGKTTHGDSASRQRESDQQVECGAPDEQ